jgi:hypothetical protein
VHEIIPAAKLVADIVAQAEQILKQLGKAK